MDKSVRVTLVRVRMETTLVIFSITITLVMADDRPLAAGAAIATPAKFCQIAQD